MDDPKSSIGRPILDCQAWNPAEFPFVVRHEASMSIKASRCAHRGSVGHGQVGGREIWRQSRRPSSCPAALKSIDRLPYIKIYTHPIEAKRFLEAVVFPTPYAGAPITEFPSRRDLRVADGVSLTRNSAAVAWARFRHASEPAQAQPGGARVNHHSHLAEGWANASPSRRPGRRQCPQGCARSSRRRPPRRRTSPPPCRGRRR